MGGHPERLTERENADRDHDRVDAVAELSDSERQPGLTADAVQTDHADRQAQGQRDEPAQP